MCSIQISFKKQKSLTIFQLAHCERSTPIKHLLRNHRKKKNERKKCVVSVRACDFFFYLFCFYKWQFVEIACDSNFSRMKNETRIEEHDATKKKKMKKTQRIQWAIMIWH